MIPAKMQNLKRWVYCSPTSKVPLNCKTLRAASSTDPDTWSDYKYAVEHLPYEHYLGYVFTEADRIVGIDIDDGYSGKNITPKALDIIFRCKSYTEKSRSGRGFHIFVEGTIPFEGRNNRDGVEIYKTGRYFIVTENVWCYSNLTENQEALDYVVKQYFSKTNEQITLDDLVKKDVFYKAEWGEIGKTIPVKPHYPPIPQGCRHQSLVSLAGQLVNDGYDEEELLTELLRANEEACEPPMGEWEVRQIVKSMRRYRK